MPRTTSRVMPWIACAVLGWGGAGLVADVPVTRVELRAVANVNGRSAVDVAGLGVWATGGRLAVFHAGEPLGWFEEFPGGGDQRMFVSRQVTDLHMEATLTRAWLVAPDLVAHCRTTWPPDGQIQARIETIGLANASVWIAAGANHGVTPGDSWWCRVAGQPVARYDVRWTAGDVCHCRAVSLVADWQPRRGQIVSLWPAPGLEGAGQASTAVSFVETRESDQLVWVAAPTKVDTPAEARVDFHRGGSYVGSGVVERRDARFWYVRTLPAAGSGPIGIGDDAVIRTVADIRQRRIFARVFEVKPTGGLINAGEIDGLSVGDVGAVYRAGSRVGLVRLTKVQRGYSVVQLTEGRESTVSSRAAPRAESQPRREAEALRRLDEVRFGDPPPTPATLALIQRVVDQTLFSARLAPGSKAPLLTPLAVRRAGATIGVAVLFELADGCALGFAIASSLSELPAAGDELTWSQ